VTAAQVAAAHRRRQQLADREFRATARGIALSALKYTKDRLTATIYAIPEDVSGTGRKKWRRTGNLRRSEKFEIPDPYTVVLVNTAAYAVPRHEAGKPGRRKINPLRISHWRDELVETFRSIVPDLVHQTIQDILRRKA
jgi:hypothetical protein